MADESNLKRLAEMTGEETTQSKLREQISAAVIELLPDGIIIIDEQGKIFMVNREAELIFGYSRSELFGQPLEILIPENLRHDHISHRKAYLEEPRSRAMGVDLPLMGKRRDSSEFPVEIAISPVPTERGLFVTATIRRKRAR